MDIHNKEGLEFLRELKDNSIDLILTDPPYIISKKSGMDTHYNKVKKNEKEKVEFVKTEQEWLDYKMNLDKPQNELDADKGKGWSKENYLRYGTILGKKYCVKTNYGEWDSEFTIEKLEEFVKLFYRKLRKGGTCIIWFDIWKMETLKKIMERAGKSGKNGFKQIRFIEWIKTNPQPRNSKVNYLTNCREVALLGVKGGKPTFNSSYDRGIYEFPMAGGKNRIHSTQKNLKLFEELIKKHSKEEDLVLDTFLGGGTTALASKNTNRKFVGCEIDEKYYNLVMNMINV